VQNYNKLKLKSKLKRVFQGLSWNSVKIVIPMKNGKLNIWALPKRVGLSAISFCEAVLNLFQDLNYQYTSRFKNSFSSKNFPQRMPLQSLTRLFAGLGYIN
tara:strand:+ start:80 stop:382 length:303 start_codon:yes stop_codon:yes gene_type:complete